MMKCRFFLAILLTGAGLVICASGFFESSPLPAAALTKNLSTALVANPTLASDDRTGGDWNPDTCHLTPKTPGPPPPPPASRTAECGTPNPSHLTPEPPAPPAPPPPVTPVSDVSQCPASPSE